MEGKKLSGEFVGRLTAGMMLAVRGTAPTKADLVYIGQALTSGQGFGNAPRLITIQATGHSETESGSIGIVNGVINALSIGISSGNVNSSNGVTNSGNNLVGQVTNTNFHSIPTLASLNWNDASDIRLLFNAAESGGRDGSEIEIKDMTLKFYNGNTVIAAIDGGHEFETTIQGVGKSGFLFGVKGTNQLNDLNSTVFNVAGSGNFRIAMEATIKDASGGPESFSAVAAAVPEPSTWAIMLLGFAGIGFLTMKRRRRIIAAA